MKTKKEQLEIAIEVDERTEAGIDEKYWYENFGLPKGNRKAKPETEEEPTPEDEEETDPTEEKPVKKPNQKNANKPVQGKKVQAQELSFWNKLKNFFDKAPR